MAGFLDKTDRVVDFVLTSEGKHLLSQGKLNFVFYSFSDDEVEYQPFIENSSSLSTVELTASHITQAENSLVREVTVGHLVADKNFNDKTNINKLLFSMPQGQKNLPRVLINPDIKSGSIELKQRKVINDDSITYQRLNTSTLEFELNISSLDIENNKGFIIKVLKSGSDGYSEVSNKQDLAGNLSYSNDLMFVVDK